jgi:hypothetical protein
VTDTGLSGSELAQVRRERHQRLTERRSEQLAARRAEVLDPTFLREALLSKVGVQHVLSAVHAHARGNTGQLGRGELRRALERMLTTNTRKATSNGS